MVNLYRVNSAVSALLSIRTFCQSSTGSDPATDFTIVDNMPSIINFDYSEAYLAFLQNVSDFQLIKLGLWVMNVHINFIAQLQGKLNSYGRNERFIVITTLPNIEFLPLIEC